jgi:hypothetical protein
VQVHYDERIAPSRALTANDVFCIDAPRIPVALSPGRSARSSAASRSTGGSASGRSGSSAACSSSDTSKGSCPGFSQSRRASATSGRDFLRRSSLYWWGCGKPYARTAAIAWRARDRFGSKAPLRASSVDRPVCPPLRTSCCAAASRRFGARNRRTALQQNFDDSSPRPRLTSRRMTRAIQGPLAAQAVRKRFSSPKRLPGTGCDPRRRDRLSMFFSGEP